MTISYACFLLTISLVHKSFADIQTCPQAEPCYTIQDIPCIGMRKQLCIVRSATGCVYAAPPPVQVCAQNSAPPVDAQDFVPTAPLCAFFVQSPAVFGIKPSILPTGPGTTSTNLINGRPSTCEEPATVCDTRNIDLKITYHFIPCTATAFTITTSTTTTTTTTATPTVTTTLAPATPTPVTLAPTTIGPSSSVCLNCFLIVLPSVSCSPTCGTGTGSKMVTCPGRPECGIRMFTCNLPVCPTPAPTANWCNWGAYSPCASTTGLCIARFIPGIQTRTRVCACPPPLAGSFTCPAASSQTQTCATACRNPSSRGRPRGRGRNRRRQRLKNRKRKKVGKIENNVPKVTRDVDAGGKDAN